MIPRFKPWLGTAELLAMFRPNKGAVARFEREFAEAFDAVDAVAFPYGRSALWAFLQAVGVNDAEVIMPAYTCAVVAHAISLSGNHPSFVDIRLSDYNMDLNLLPQAINQNTRAIVATHLFGYPLDLDRVEAIVAEAEAIYGHKIWLIQDCAHSFGASWKGRLVGTSGDVGLYALNISKMMTSIFGGMLTFQDRQLANQVRAWRDQNFRKPGFLKPWLRRFYLLAVYIAFTKPVYGLTWWLQEKTPLLNKLTKSYHLDNQVHFPPNYLDQMSEVEAAVGSEQLKKYSSIIARRRANAAWFHINLPRIEGWVFPPTNDDATYSHYVIRVPNRDVVVKTAGNSGLHLGELIQYSVPSLEGYLSDGFEFSNEASKTTINIPIGSFLTHKMKNRVKKLIAQVNKGYS
jgi:dTDP-4-amino-4,6-dideoxygalactose transaminase